MNTTQTSRTGTNKSSGRGICCLTQNARRVAFTLIELLVVIGIIAILAGLIVGLSGYAAHKIKESRIRAELSQLETAIGGYKAQFGHYPPDNVVSKTPLVVNSVSNSLYYELTGVVIDEDPGRQGSSANAKFRSPNRAPGTGFGSTILKAYFGVDGIENAKNTAKEIKSFLPNLTAKQHHAINEGMANQPELDVLVVPEQWPLNSPTPPTPVKGLNPWHYVSTQPTNNPATFDLWAEYVEKGKIKIICNWSKDALEKQP